MPWDNRYSINNYKKNLIFLAVAITLLLLFTWIASADGNVAAYSAYIFQPLQLLRTSITRYIPFCIGDVIYVGWVLSMIYTIIVWLYFLLTLSRNYQRFGISFVKFVTNVCLLCLFFMIGWGGNYYKQPLKEVWRLDENEIAADDSSLIRFDKFLITKMNTYIGGYKDYSFKRMERLSWQQYKQYTDCYNDASGLKVKHTLFGNMMQYIGVQGYFNPFTGEAQVNRNLPDFMLPFVISHEMAHQAGIAAEDDANLVAYALCVKSGDSTFRYSAYFNLWLYTHSRLKMQDSVLANEMKAMVNPVSLAHLDTLRAQRIKYRSIYSRYGANMYDQYLKLNNQEDGIESYQKASLSAWIWEQQNAAAPQGRLRLP